MSADEDPSSGTSLHEGIARLESELEELEAAAERCRRTILLARVAAAGGGGLLLLAVWRGDATFLATGIAAVLGGFALSGTTRATRDKLLAEMEDQETRRTDLIEALGLTGSGPANDIGGKPARG